MILIILGTQDKKFDRLLTKIDKLITKNVITDKVIVQAGSTKFTSSNMQIFDLTSPIKLERLIKKADFIITHGGVGSILSCLKYHKKIIAIPRLAKYKEHHNDHQIQIVNELSRNNYILKSSIDNLEKVLANVSDFKPKKFNTNNTKMINIIDEFINKNN